MYNIYQNLLLYDFKIIIITFFSNNKVIIDIIWIVLIT